MQQDAIHRLESACWRRPGSRTTDLHLDHPVQRRAVGSLAAPALPISALSLALVVLSACGATPQRTPGERSQPAPTVKTASPAKSPRKEDSSAKQPIAAVPPGTRQASTPRIVAMGDVHGDLEATLAALRLAGAIDADRRWIGGSLVVVQTGDQLDRGDGERAILDLFERLTNEAKAAGGQFIALNGNHELMNALGDFRYVTPGGFADFDSLAASADSADLRLKALAPEQIGRGVAFFPGGPYAKQLAQRDVIHIHDRTVFAHGGVLPAHVAYGVEKINAQARAWLSGERADPPTIALDDDAPVWTRRFSADTNQADCDVLVQVLGLLDVDRMVVAHTVQEGGITSACNDLVWRIDVGMSAHYGGPIEVLELTPTTAKVLHGSR